MIRRTALMAQRNLPVRLGFDEGSLTLTAQTQDVGEARESLPVDFHGDQLEIGFNPDFLRDGVESVEGDTVQAAADQPAAAGAAAGRRRIVLVPDHADPAALVARLPACGSPPSGARDFRCYERRRGRPAGRAGGSGGAERRRQDGLIEMIHFGCLRLLAAHGQRGRRWCASAPSCCESRPTSQLRGRHGLDRGRLPAGRAQAGDGGRRGRALGGAAARPLPGARVHARPAAAGAGRAGPAPRLPRSRAGAAVAGAGAALGRVRPRAWRSEITCCAGSAPAPRRRMRWIPGTSSWRRRRGS